MESQTKAQSSKPAGELKKQVVKGGAITVTSQVLMLLIRTATTMIMARLLVPEVFGLVAMVTVITSFIEIFSDMGLSMAAVQRKELSAGQVTNLFWANLCVSTLMGIVVALMAPGLVWFYKEPRLFYITVVTGISFPVVGIAIQHRAMLQRNMKFGRIAVVELISLIVTGVASIVLAVLGMNYWAIIYGTLIGKIVRSAGFWIAHPWMPGMPHRGSGVRSLLVFGGHVTGFNLVNYWAGHMDNILVGKWWGSRELGLYSKAYSLVMLPVALLRSPINAVMIPALSKLQDEPDRFRSMYLKAASLLAFCSMPLMAFLAILSEEIVLLFLGPNWVASSQIFRIMAIAGLIFPVVSTRGAVYVSLGQANRWFHWAILNTSVRIACFAAGLRWGGIGVAWGYTSAIYIMLLPSMWHCYRFAPIKVTQFLAVLIRPGISSLVMAGAIIGLRSIVNLHAFAEVALCFVAGSVVYLAVISLVPGGRRFIGEMVGLSKTMFKRSK